MNVREIRVWVEDEQMEGVILSISDDEIIVKLENGQEANCPPEAVKVIYEEYEV